MRNLILKIKEYWNIWGSLFISLFWAWWKGFSITTMDKTTSFLTMTLMFVGLFTFIKSRVKHEKLKWQKDNDKLFGEKLVESSKSFKAINMAINPEGEISKIEKLLSFIIKKGKSAMKKVGKFFTWVGTYWQQLLGYFASLLSLAVYIYALIEDKFEFVLQYLPDTPGWNIGVKIGIGIIVLLLTILQIRNQSVWKGIGSLERATQENNEKVVEVETHLSANAKNKIKDIINKLKSNEKTIKSTLTTLENEKKKVEKEISTIQELLKLNVKVDTNTYNTLLEKDMNLTSEIKSNENEITKVESEIAKYEKLL